MGSGLKLSWRSRRERAPAWATLPLGWFGVMRIKKRGEGDCDAFPLVVFKGMMHRPLERFKDFGQMTLGVGADIAFKLLECGKEKRSFFCER